MHRQIDREVSAINVQLRVRRKRKTRIFSLWILDLPQHDVSRHIHLERGWNQELIFRLIGVDVKSGGYAEIQTYRGLRRARSRHQCDGSQRHRRGLAGLSESCAREYQKASDL